VGRPFRAITGVEGLSLIPLQLELPVRANEAAALAEVVFEVAGGKRLNDDLRGRIASRADLLAMQTIVAHCGSLEADPIHPSSYLMAIDGVREGIAKPYLLRIATATAPASGLFQKSILIGRMRPGGGREIVINATPFGPENREGLHTFAEQVDRVFLPRLQGASPCIASPNPEAFAEFRAIQRSGGLNWASFTTTIEAALCGAIRAGWREGYSVQSPPISLLHLSHAENHVLDSAGCTKFVFDVAALPAAERLHAVEMMCGFLTKVRAGQSSWKKFDLEISWLSSTEPTPAEEIADLLGALRGEGRIAQAASPRFGADAEKAVEAIRHAGAVVSLSSMEPAFAEIAKACDGRVQCVAAPGANLRELVALIRG